MNNTKITVYIVSYNYGKYLGDAIESVLKQTCDNWELFIIDDNSTDMTSEVINLYSDDKRIKVFKTDGIGLASISNLVIDKANGEYVIRLDGDDIFDENILLILNNYLDRNPEYAMVFADYYLIDEFNEIFDQKKSEKIYEKNHIFDIPPNGACTLFRKKLIEKFGGYRVDLGAQDGFDIWSKIKKTYKYGNINLPLFYYRRHSNNLTNNKKRIFQARRKIKQNCIKDDIMKFKPIIAVIPCRKNYDFISDLWKQKINGITLIQRSIEACLNISIFDYIIIACDNTEAKSFLNQYHDQRLHFFNRDQNDTIRSKSIVYTLEKIAKIYDPKLNGITTINYIQTPFVKKETLEESIYTVIMNSADSSVGVEEIKFPLYRRSSHGLQPINLQKNFSSDFEIIYCDTSTSLSTRNKNLKFGSLSGSTIVNFLVSPEECFFIDSERKLKIARVMEEER